MNPLMLFTLGRKSSLKLEIKIVLLTLAALLFLPILGAIVLANSGFTLIANALVSVNPTTHRVEVRDANGLIVANLELSTVWPTNGVITQEFGIPNPPYELKHSGIDIAGKLGDPITPFMAGKVTKAGSATIGCGQCVYVDHGHGIVSSYSHLSEVKATVGQEVKPGDVIGLQGATGWATGVHLHFVVRVYGIPVDPRTFMVGEPERAAR